MLIELRTRHGKTVHVSLEEASTSKLFSYQVKRVCLVSRRSRSRKSVVTVQKEISEFHTWFDQLLNAGKAVPVAPVLVKERTQAPVYTAFDFYRHFLEGIPFGESYSVREKRKQRLKARKGAALKGPDMY
jgi:hypothetical protein